MKLKAICEALDADIITGNDMLETDIMSACGSDLLSDVMAFAKDSSVLLTGLVTVQTIRTAHLMDIRAIIFVRGKIPTQDMVDEAQKNGMLIATTKLSMYLACGKLYESGLKKGSMYGE